MQWLNHIRQWWNALPRTNLLSIVKGKGWPRKNVRRRTKEPTEIVLHESCSRSRKGTHRVLKRRGLSVEYTVDREGVVHEHANPETHSCKHAGGKHNRRSVAIEVLNRYYGKHAKPDETVIKTCWAHRKLYILPTRRQCEAVWQLVVHLDVLFETDLRRFPGVVDDQFRWGRSKHAAKAPGVKAHHRWHHADALFAEHYCACRDRGMISAEAYSWSKIAAGALKRTTGMPDHDELDQG